MENSKTVKTEVKPDEKVKYDNPIDEAIGEFINNTKEQMKDYLTSDNKKVQLYAQAKISELNQYIEKKKIDIYKAKKGELDEVKLKELMTKSEAKISESEKIGQQIMVNLSKFFKSNDDNQVKENDLKIDSKFEYKTIKDGTEEEIMVEIIIKGEPKDGKILAKYSDEGAKKYGKNTKEQDFSIKNIRYKKSENEG